MSLNSAIEFVLENFRAVTYTKENFDSPEFKEAWGAAVINNNTRTEFTCDGSNRRFKIVEKNSSAMFLRYHN